MAKRVIIGGLLGGIALFIWGALAHMVLRIGSVGFREIPNESAVLTAVTASINEPGLYIFPGLGLPAHATMAQQNAAMKEADARAQTGPNGLLIIHPRGGGGFTAARLINEFVLNVVQALLLATLLAWALPIVGYVPRVAFVTVAGFFGALATNIQYWNWYGFPANYSVAYIVNETIGFLIVGLVVAALIKPSITHS
jgi:hypothetical protein